mgnify:CR=1 FL=1
MIFLNLSMVKKVLVIYVHPNKQSFCTALGMSYVKGLKEDKKEVKELHLYDLKFEMRFYGYKDNNQEFEKDLKKAQDLILWADHITFVYPIWWFNYPSILKSFLERVLLPGFAFKYSVGPMPEKFLKGKTMRAIVTMDAPLIYYKMVVRKPDYHSLKNDLDFCGVKVKDFNYFGSVKTSDESKRKTWIGEVYSLGLKE